MRFILKSKIPKKKIRAYALKNAIAYKGKANQGAVISALFNEGMKKNEVKDYCETRNLIGPIECSAKSGDNVESVFEMISREMMKKINLV